MIQDFFLLAGNSSLGCGRIVSGMKAVVFSFFLFLLSCSNLACAAERYVKIFSSALDFSTSSSHPYNSASAALVIDNMKEQGVTNLIVTLIPNNLQWSGYKNNFKNFLGLAKSKGVDIHLNILQTNTYTYTEKHAEALYRVQKCIDFIKGNTTYFPNPIKSIHFDIEPNTLPEWKSANWDANVSTRRYLMRQWIDLMESIRALVKDVNGLSDLKIYSEIDYYYDSKYRQGIFPEGNPAILGSSLDAVFVMAYIDDTDPSEMTTEEKFNHLKKISQDEVADTPTSVSIRASDFATYQELMSIASQLDSYFQGSGDYLGISFHKYETLRESFENQ